MPYKIEPSIVNAPRYLSCANSNLSMFLLMIHDSKSIWSRVKSYSTNFQYILRAFNRRTAYSQLAIYTNLGIGNQGKKWKSDPIIISIMCSIK